MEKYTIQQKIFNSSGEELGLIVQKTNTPEEVLEWVDILPTQEQNSIISFSSDEDMMVEVEIVLNHYYKL